MKWMKLVKIDRCFPYVLFLFYFFLINGLGFFTLKVILNSTFSFLRNVAECSKYCLQCSDCHHHPISCIFGWSAFYPRWRSQQIRRFLRRAERAFKKQKLESKNGWDTMPKNIDYGINVLMGRSNLKTLPHQILQLSNENVATAANRSCYDVVCPSVCLRSQE